jgi:hypothetical protein
MCTMICDTMMSGRGNFVGAMLCAGALALALLMTGCAQRVEPDDARMSTTPEQERTAPTQPAVRPQEAAVVEQQPTAEPGVPAAQPEAPVETAVAPVHTASELMGKNPSEVTALMGAPSRVEQRAASTVWVYQDGDCGLDVYFFLDMSTSDERVLTVEPTAESAAAAAPPAAEAGSPAGEATSDAQPTAAAEGSVVDVCYGKLRRS